MIEPKFVPVDSRGKPGPPSLPSTDLVLPMLCKHFGQRVVLHTDGAEAYAAACKALANEGCKVLHDSVIHSQGQYTAFHKHDVTGDSEWEACDMAIAYDGKTRIRVEKGVEKAEGHWRHLKHGQSAIPEEVHNDDERLDMYAQSLVWRMQCCGCPYRHVLRMTRAFRNLPLERKSTLFSYGFRHDEGKEDGKKKKICYDKPPVMYCNWELKPYEHMGDDEADDDMEPAASGRKPKRGD